MSQRIYSFADYLQNSAIKSLLKQLTDLVTKLLKLSSNQRAELTTGNSYNWQLGNKVSFKPACLEPLIMPNFAHFRLISVNWSDFREKKAGFQANSAFL